MKIYTLNRKQLLPMGLEQAWEFFSTPANLLVISPAYMRLRILTELKAGPVCNGMKIDYKVCPLLGIPMTWRSEICNVEAPHTFTDRQERGPYSLWEHRHHFKAVNGGIEMTDRLQYALPFSLLGNIMHGLVVRRRLEQIFDYREQRLIELFGVYKPVAGQ